MKKYFLIFCFLSFCLRGQIYTAGQILPGYADINPDTLLNYSGPPETYSIDVNGDNQSDLRLVTLWLMSPGQQTAYIRIEPLNLGCYVRLGRVDSVYHNFLGYWMVSNVAKPLASGDTINKANAKWHNSLLCISDQSGSAGTYVNIQDWVSSSDRYIGVKYQTATDTLFGWIRVHVPVVNKCYLKDYSLNCRTISLTAASTASMICAGETATLTANGANSYTWSTGSNGSSITINPTVTVNYTVTGASGISGCMQSAFVITQNVDACVGINEYIQDQIRIYPNPAGNVIHISVPQEVLDDSGVTITNSIGQQIINIPEAHTIDISTLASGCYIVRLISRNKTSYSKFVKQ